MATKNMAKTKSGWLELLSNERKALQVFKVVAERAMLEGFVSSKEAKLIKDFGNGAVDFILEITKK